MDTFMCSSWYYIRYVDPHDATARLGARATSIAGCPSTSTSAASSTRSCTCSTRASSRRSSTTPACVGFKEPFKRLFTQGMIYKDGAKMSKSKGNVVAPDELIARYGADSLRLYALFLGPPEDDAEWTDGGIAGCYRFLQRLWTLVGGLAGAGVRVTASPASPDGLERGRPGACAQDALGDRQVDARLRRALPLQHRRGRGHGAAERDRGAARGRRARGRRLRRLER